MSKKDHYEILGVERSEDQSGIKTAFRRLAKRHHPDLSGPEETRHFQEILEAYAVLSDPSSRASYNESLRKQETPVAFGKKARHSEPHQPVEPVGSPGPWFSMSGRERRPGFSVHEIHDLFFNSLAMSGPLGRGAPTRRALDVAVRLSREEAIRGGILPLRHPGLLRCRFCGGMGLDQFLICTSCHARGIANEGEAFPARIPAGIKDGSTLHFAVGDLERDGVLLRVHIQVGTS